MVTVESHQTSQHNVNQAPTHEHSTTNYTVDQVGVMENEVQMNEDVIMDITPVENEPHETDVENHHKDTPSKYIHNEDKWQTIPIYPNKASHSNTINTPNNKKKHKKPIQKYIQHPSQKSYPKKNN